MITCFTPMGHIRFARSLIRFCGMSHREALTFLNRCARANFDAYRAADPDEREGDIHGIDMDKWSFGKPYYTEVQLFKSMQAVFYNVGGTDNAALLPEFPAQLRAMMNDLRERFFHSYGVEIDGAATVYALCEDTLEPMNEPAVCMLSDLLIVDESM